MSSGFQYTDNNILRQVFISGFLVIPYVGGCCSSLAKAFWPEDGSNPLQDLENQVLQLAQVIEDDTWMTTLRGKLDELRMDLKMLKELPPDKDNTTPDSVWSTNFKTLYADVNKFWDYFVDPAQVQLSNSGNKPDDQPQRTLQYLVSFGTIYLTAVRERTLYFKNIYSVDKGQNLEDLIEQSQKEFDDGFRKLTDKVASERTRAIEWRKSQIGLNQDTYHPPQTVTGIPVFPMVSYQVTDAGDATKNQSFNEGDTKDGAGGHAYATRYCKNLLWDITIGYDGYTSKLDLLTDEQRWWGNLSPQGGGAPEPGFVYWACRLGSGYREADLDDNMRTVGEGESDDGWDEGEFGRLCQLDLHWDSGALKGVQSWFNNDRVDNPEGTSFAVLNGATGTDSATINFAISEIITQIGGAAGNWIDRLQVNTNLRVKNGQGPVGNVQAGDSMIWSITNDKDTAATRPLMSDGNPEDDGALFFTVLTDGQNIVQLKIVWQKWDRHNGAQIFPERTLESLRILGGNDPAEMRITFDLPTMTTSESGPGF